MVKTTLLEVRRIGVAAGGLQLSGRDAGVDVAGEPGGKNNNSYIQIFDSQITITNRNLKLLNYGFF
jgi:hypothetical protein